MTPNRALGLYTAATWAAIPALMLWGDIPIAQFFHLYRDTPWENFFAIITNFANGFIWYSLAVFGLAIAAVRARGATAAAAVIFRARVRSWTFMIAAMATSGFAEIAIKFILGRERPRFLFRDGAATFHPFHLAMADSSFPSGHTQSICSAMLALAIIYPPLRLGFFVVAVLVSASRIVIGAHYASDVAGGAWLAVMAIVLWRRRFERNGADLKWAQLTDPQALSASAPPPATSN